jgi:hypothetical protein
MAKPCSVILRQRIEDNGIIETEISSSVGSKREEDI